MLQNIEIPVINCRLNWYQILDRLRNFCGVHVICLKKQAGLTLIPPLKVPFNLQTKVCNKQNLDT